MMMKKFYFIYDVMMMMMMMMMMPLPDVGVASAELPDRKKLRCHLTLLTIALCAFSNATEIFYWVKAGQFFVNVIRSAN